MSRMGRADYSELKELHKKFEQLNDLQIFEFFEAASKELAARLLSLVIPRTPVGEYGHLEKPYRKDGGTLRRGWTGGEDTAAYQYAEMLDVNKVGHAYQIEIINPVDYAVYVEYGHRQTPGRYVPAIGAKLKQSWVDGQFMLTISEDELRQATPKILQKKINDLFKDVFG